MPSKTLVYATGPDFVGLSHMQVTACCFRNRITVLGLLLASFMFIHDRDNYCLFYLDIKSELRPSEPQIILLADSREIWTTTMLLDAEMAKSV